MMCGAHLGEQVRVGALLRSHTADDGLELLELLLGLAQLLLRDLVHACVQAQGQHLTIKTS
jgi:hypothetical protein